MLFLIYARKSDKCYWNHMGSKSSGMDASMDAYSLLENIESDHRFTNCHWKIQVVTVHEDQLKDGVIPATLKPSTKWYDFGMIPYCSYQQNPDQRIYNGGN